MYKKEAKPEQVESVESVEMAKPISYVFAKNGSADFGSFKAGDVAKITGEVLDQYLAAGIVKIG